VKKHGQIKRAEVIELCKLNGNQAYRLLSRMCKQGKLKMLGNPPGGAYYVLP